MYLTYGFYTSQEAVHVRDIELPSKWCGAYEMPSPSCQEPKSCRIVACTGRDTITALILL